MDYEMEEEEETKPETPPVRMRTGMFEGPIKCLDIDISMGSNQVRAINLVQLGNTFTQRIGRRIQMSRIIMGNLWGPSAWTTIYFVYDRQPNGVLPNYSDIFACYNYSATYIGQNNMINPNNINRFEILALRTMATGTGTTGYFPPYIDNDYVCINHEVQFQNDSTPPVIGDISTGALYVCTNNGLSQGFFRILYTDK